MTGELKRALLLLNPNSRKGAEADLDAGIALLERSGIQIKKVVSEGAGQSAALIRAEQDQCDLVIVGGGDGTISSMAGVLHECQLPFAILPLGTANDLARSLQLPDDLLECFDVIAGGRQATIDLGSVNDKLFFNVANIGLGVKVTQELTPEVKKTWGVFSYLKAFFAALARIRQFRVILTVDGKVLHQRSIHLGIGNGRYYGGGNIVDDAARIDDGLLSLYSLRPQTVWELLTLAPLLRGGRQREAERVFRVRAKSIEIQTRPRHLAIHADGDPIGETPARFQILPGALQVIVPTDFDTSRHRE